MSAAYAVYEFMRKVYQQKRRALHSPCTFALLSSVRFHSRSVARLSTSSLSFGRRTALFLLCAILAITAHTTVVETGLVSIRARIDRVCLDAHIVVLAEITERA